MMHDKIVAEAVRWFGAVSLGLVCGGFTACAGTDTPPVDSQLEDDIADRFTNGGVGTAGAGNAGSGNGGSGNTPAAGSGNTPAAGSGGAGGQNPPPAAGGGTQEPPGGDEPPPSTGPCDGFAVLETNCSSGGCHGAGATFGNFAESEEVALGFVDAEAAFQCSGEGALLDPANPRASVIIQKVNGTHSCGADMPIGGSLSDEDIDCLEEWIGSL
jgi:hypothetical protein